MTAKKKNLIISCVIVVLILVLGIGVASWTIPTGPATIFKTEDGAVVNVIDNGFKTHTIVPEESTSASTDDEIHYGDIIERNGIKERVFAIAEDGSFITETIE